MKTECELFLYVLDGHGYTFENMTWLGNCFEDNFLNMAWEMWCASAQREGYKLVPVEATDEMRMAAYTMDGDLVGDTSDIYKAMIGAVE